MSSDTEEVTPPPDDKEEVTPPPDDTEEVTPPPDDKEEVTPPPDDTEEVTPPPDVTLGKLPQSKVKRSAKRKRGRTESMDPQPSSSGQQNPGSAWPLYYTRIFSSTNPPTSSRDLQGLDSLDPGPEPVSQPEPDITTLNPAGKIDQRLSLMDWLRRYPLSRDTSRNVGSPESHGASRRRSSMDKWINFREEPDGVRWLRPELKKYLCELVPDTDTMNKNLQLSDDGRTLTYEDDVQKYPDHPDRFHQRPQLLCRNALTGRCYWEVDWKGIINIAVSSRGIAREGDGEDCWFGRNDQSWSLYCSDRHGYTVSHKERPICSDGHFLAYHDNNPTTCSTTSSEDSNRAAVYVDVPAGTLSFFVVSGDELIHLHTFQTTFTDPLYPGFGFWGGSGASVSLPSV